MCGDFFVNFFKILKKNIFCDKLEKIFGDVFMSKIEENIKNAELWSEIYFSREKTQKNVQTFYGENA